MRSSWSRWVLNPMTSVLLRDRWEECRDTEKGHVKMKVGSEFCSHKSRTFRNHQNLEEEKDSLLEPLEGMWTQQLLTSDFRLPNLWKNTFLIFLSHMVCYSSHRKRIHHPSKTRVPPSSNSSEWQLWSQNFEAVHDCSLHLTSKPSSLFNLIGFTLQLQSESSSSSQPPWP